MKIVIFLIEILIAFLFYKLVEYKCINKEESKAVIAITNTSFLEKIINKKIFEKIKYNFIKLNIPFNVFSVGINLFVGILLSNIMYFLALKVFKIKSVALIIAFPFIFIMFFIINYLADRKQRQLEEVMNDFFIQLKGTFNINNDCIEAFRRIQNTVLEPFRTYIIYMLK